MSSSDPTSEIELGKGSARFAPEAPLATSKYHPLQTPSANLLTGFFSPYRFSGSGSTNANTAESLAGRDAVDAQTPELSPLLNLDNSSSFEPPSFGRWYSRRDKLRARPRVKILIVLSVLAIGVIFTYFYIHRTLERSCWTWKGKLGGGSCSPWTKPSEEKEFLWDRHKTEQPKKEIMVPAAIPDFALEYGTYIESHSLSERCFS